MVLGSRRRWIGALALIACAAAGCADEVRGQLVVVVTSDMRVPGELDEVGVRVIGPLGARALDQEHPLTGSGAVTLPFSFGVAPASDDPNRVVTIEVDAKLAGAVRFTVRRRAQFVDGDVRQLVVFLASRCVGEAATCAPDTTCELGGCVPELVDVRALPRYAPNRPLPDGGPPRESGPMDAGDAGPRDLGGDERRDDDLGPIDAGPEEDAGPDEDTGPIDAGDDDMGPIDSGPMDAGDSGRDMGPRDLGIDAGDAGPGDMGAPDAGPGDMGAPDAGDAMTSDGGADSGMCEESPCRIVSPQCGCPGTLGCTFRPDGTTECRALGSRGDGERCDDDSLACQPGFGCIGSIAGDPFPRCRAICRATTDCTTTAACLEITSFAGYGSCQTFCVLSETSSCPDGLGCVLGNLNVIEGGTVQAPICTTVGTAMIGDACSGNMCAPGLACVTPPAMATQCRPWCVRPGTCPVGEGTCSPVSPPPIFDGIEYGVCIP